MAGDRCQGVASVMPKDSTKNIRAILQLFGYADQARPWFISRGSGIVEHPEKPFRVGFYVYGICTAGRARLRINNEEVWIQPHTFFTAIPSSILQVQEHTTTFRARLLVFERGFLLRNILDARQLEHLGFFNFDTLTHVPFTKAEAVLLGKLLDRVYDQSLEDSVFQQQKMQSLILYLLFETAEIYFRYRNQLQRKRLGREEALFMQFMKLVPAYFKTEQALQFYADRLFISSRYLIRVCRNIAGKTPAAILAETLLSEARLLLNNPANNIGMVAHQLNYGSTAAFSKFFRKHTGVSPLQWKHSHL